MAKSRVCRLTLRLPPDFKDYLSAVADDLGIGENDLMNLLLRRAAGAFLTEEFWERGRPGGSPRSQVTLRIEADLDELIRGIGGKRRNGLISEMLAHSLPAFVVERRIYKEYLLTGRYKTLFRQWRRTHKGATVESFDGELRRLLSGQPDALDGLERPGPADPILHQIATRGREKEHLLPDVDGPLTDQEDAF